jgi:hypothetical protein
MHRHNSQDLSIPAAKHAVAARTATAPGREAFRSVTIDGEYAEEID